MLLHPARVRPLASAVVATAVAAGVLGALPSSASAAGPLVAPSGLDALGDVGAGFPVLSWQSVAGATSYELQVDDDPAFGTPLISVPTVNVAYAWNQVLPAGTQYWRVRALDPAATSPWSQAEVEVPRTAAPRPTAPADEALLAQPDEAPLLEWSVVPGATQYVVQLDDEPGFVGAREVSTRASSLVAPDPLSPSVPHFWRVKAARGTGIESAYSATRSFSLGALAVPQVVGPDSSPTNDLTDVVLDWAPVPGARYYDLEVSTDDDFATSTIIDTKTRLTGTRYSPKATYDNNQYFWRVRAVSSDSTVKSEWSPSVNQFRRSWSDRPALVHPEAGATAVSDPFFYEWSPVPHASDYQLQVSTSPTFDDESSSLCSTAGTTYTPGTFRKSDDVASVASRDVSGCTPYLGRVTYWRVRAFDRAVSVTAVQGLFSATQSFTYRPRDFVAQSVSSTFSPAHGATVAVPTLTWAPDRDADTYVVKVARANGATVVSATTHATSWTSPKLLDPVQGPFTWTIQAVEANGEPGSVIYSQSFQTGGAGDPGDTGTPLTATSGDGTTSRRAPTLAWTPQPGAAYYKLRTFAAGTNVLAPGSAELATTELAYPAATYTGTAFLERGDYEWQVTAYDKVDAVLGQSQRYVFHTAALDPVSDQRLAVSGSGLDDGAGCTAAIGAQLEACAVVPTTPTLAWEPVRDASFYQVYVSQDDKFTNLLEQAATTSTRWTPTTGALFPAMPDSQAGASYYWFVRPCKSLTVCGSASPVSVTPSVATNVFRKKSPSISGGTASAGTGDGSEVTFEWDDYHVTNVATAWSAGNGGTAASNQTARTYHLEVSTTPSFTTLLESADVDQPTFTSPTRLYPDGPVYWRVRAADYAGNDLAWSPTWTWTKSGPTVAPTSPVDLAQITASVPLRWEARAYAQKYEVQVAANDDANFSRDNILFTEQTTQTAYTWGDVVPVSPAPYVWRVRRIDSAGHLGAWSAVRRFVNPALPPTLLTPAAGANVAAARGLFTWTFVPGATSYKVEVRKGAATTSWTTTGSAYTPTTALSTGERQWRVTALDGAKATVGVSDWRTFRVEAPSVVTPPTLVGSGKVGIDLRVSAATFDPPAGTTTSQWFRATSATATPAAITGATDETYTVRPADVGTYLTVRVTATTDGYADTTATSAAVLAVRGDAPVATAAPVVTGDPRVGELLAVTAGSWPGSPALSYQWFRDGSLVASGPSYRLVGADLGRRVHVVETASVPGYAPGRTASDPVTPATGSALVATAVPVLTPASVTAGDLLSASTGTWTPPTGNTYAYEWFRDGTTITGATASTYRLVGDDVGRAIHVVVTASTPGRPSGTATSEAVVPNAALQPQTLPTVTGSPVSGRTLTAQPGTWSAPARFRYQWFVDGTAVSPTPSSSPTFVLRAADIGHRVHVRVLATATGYLEGRADTVPVLVTSEGGLVATSAPSITGVARPGSVLTVAPGTWPVAATYAYQWYRSGVPIGGATGATYTATVADAGRSLAVLVTASAPHWDSGAAVAAPVAVPRLTSTTGIALSRTRVTKRQQATTTTTVVVPGLATPGGTVSVYDGARRLTTLRLTGNRVTYRLPRLAVGVHTIKAVYSGTTQVAPSTRAVRLSVTRR